MTSTIPLQPTTPRLDRCHWLPRQPPVFVQLGRHGDLILLLPAFLAIYQRTGLKPVVIVSKDYAATLEGVSYVTPDVVKEGWWAGIPKARAYAARKYGSVIVPQWWNDAATAGDLTVDLQREGVRVLQCHGDKWGVDMDANPDFGSSMWHRAGFTRKEMLTLPLVFDRRDKAREEALVRQHVHGDRPLLLYNFTGVSSPFGYVPEMSQMLANWRTRFQMVDLGEVRAARIYDMLGLYDRAAGLITIDTATGHLAPASRVPTLWFTRSDWSRSVPRGNVALHIAYNEFPKRAREIPALLEKWAKI